MELHQLRYFAAVAEMENFTRAAERCFVSQPSLSQQIIKLEDELGQPLLERLGRKVRLTDAGRALHERAVKILAAVDEAKECVRAEKDWTSGSISVGAILTIAPYLLPDVVKSFLKSYPAARVTVRENFTAHIVRACLAGELDIGIVALPIHDERLVVEPLFSEELLVAVPAKHALRTRKQVGLADLTEWPFVLLDEIHCLGEQIISFCRHHDCQPVVSCVTAQLLTVQEMVSLGQGISLVPEMAARKDDCRRRAYVSLGDEAPRRDIAMIWHRDRHQGPLVKAFFETMRTTATDQNGPRNSRTER